MTVELLQLDGGSMIDNEICVVVDYIISKLGTRTNRVLHWHCYKYKSLTSLLQEMHCFVLAMLTSLAGAV